MESDSWLSLGRKRSPTPALGTAGSESQYKFPMHTISAHLMPIATLVAGALVLLIPRCLSYVVAIYLIAVGLIGLNGIYHFVK
jgi:hypothetical protein